jgi:gluconate 2-dehydrogenase gamma chain
MTAAVDRILPRDQDPGALDANVPEYIDRMLQNPELHQMRLDFVAGTAALNRRSLRMFKQPFPEATAAQRDELLRLFRDSAPGTGEENYYSLLVTLTLEGFLGDPSYGGNKDKVGWALVGFEKVDATKADPGQGYDGSKTLHHLHGGGH